MLLFLFCGCLNQTLMLRSYQKLLFETQEFLLQSLCTHCLPLFKSSKENRSHPASDQSAKIKLCCRHLLALSKESMLMQEGLTAKGFIFTEAGCYETLLNENHNWTEYQMYLLLVGLFSSR